MAFRVYGYIDNMWFDWTFENIEDWKAERAFIETQYKLDVRGAHSV